MNTLRKTVSEKDEESRKHQSMLDAKLQELEQMKSISGECCCDVSLVAQFTSEVSYDSIYAVMISGEIKIVV